MDIGHVKLWFTTILCWLLFRTKFNCNFVQSYVPVFYMGFLCKGCVWERVWRLKAKWRAKKFSRVDCEKPSHEVKHVLSTWLECEESWHMVTISLREYLTGKAFSRDTRETFCFANLSYLIDQVPTHYIYQHIKRSAFQRENSSHYPWEWEIVILTILYIIHCGFSSTPTSPFLNPWEVDSLNTYHTHSECQVRFWCCCEVLEEAKIWSMQSSVLQDPES